MIDFCCVSEDLLAAVPVHLGLPPLGADAVLERRHEVLVARPLVGLGTRAVDGEADEVVLPRQPVVVVEVDGAAVRRRRPLAAGLVGPVGRSRLFLFAVLPAPRVI